MNIIEGWLAGWKRYADFRGRSRRMEFWGFFVGNWVVFSVLYFVVIAGAIGMKSEEGDPKAAMPIAMIFMLLASLAYVVPALAVTVRRFHDTGRSGWMYPISILIYMAGYIPLGFGFLSQLVPAQADGPQLKVPVVVMALGGLAVLAVFIYWLIVFFGNSQPGDNKWGPNPKEQMVVA